MDNKFTGALQHRCERRSAEYTDEKQETRIRTMLEESERAHTLLTGYLTAAICILTVPDGEQEVTTLLGRMLTEKRKPVGVNLCRGCLTKALHGAMEMQTVIEDMIRLYDDSK